MAFKISKYVQSAELAERAKPKETPPNSHTLKMQPGKPNAQFINITDSKSLDKASRTQVRVQAMRDYHRRRTEKGKGESQPNPVPQKPLSAKAQTQKFRLGQENILRPWIPVKSAVVQRSSAYENETRQPLDKNTTQVEFRSMAAVEKHTRILPRESNEKVFSQDLTSMNPAQTVIEPWLSAQDFILKTSNLYDSPGAGHLDPFSAMSLVITPRAQLLIHHYFNVRLQSAWLMMPMRKTLFSLAIHDPAMFHSFMTHYATAFNVQEKGTSSTESLFHATMAANIINARISNSALALTDETVATVANMAAYESSNGTAASMIVHMDGLEKMVNMRGGIENGGFSLIVQRMIGWTDYHVAASLFLKPRFPPLQLPQTAQPREVVQPSGGLAVHIVGRASPGLESLFSEVQDLSQTLEILRQRARMPGEDIWYSDKIYYLQRNLFDIAHDSSYHKPLDSVCALAALIYCGHCLRDIPLRYSVIAKAVTRLQCAVELYEASNFWIGDFELTKKMLWVLAFGGVAAEGQPERPWFVQRFRSCAHDLQLGNWDNARSILDEALWGPGLEEAGVRLFDEANEAADEA